MSLATSNGFAVHNPPAFDFAGCAATQVVTALTGKFNGDSRTDLALVRQAPGWSTVPVALATR
ncbi:hypothetical protein [Geminicoccus flavidas]|uniref:hypothetical protein n=1 Tax=Geminicoccus flavidas TaxID=2506407 RepID=UPI0013590BBF|nr:hypothetical protein [Geminicoccus flavidas]